MHARLPFHTKPQRKKALSLSSVSDKQEKREKKKNKAISRKRRVREGNDIGAQETKN